MGKGKAKGWRPPAANDSKAGLLLGSASHLTGDSIASPVQLRDEGRALPKNHPNFGDEWGKGGKGKGATGDASATGANSIPVVKRPEGGWAAGLDGEKPNASATGSNCIPVQRPKPCGAPPVDQKKENAEDEKPALLKASAKAHSPAAPADQPTEAVKAEEEEDGAGNSSGSAPPTAPKAAAVTPSEPVRSDGKTEIERRREAMLQRERAVAGRQAEEVLAEAKRPPEEGAEEAAKRRREEVAAEEGPAEKRPREATATPSATPAASAAPAAGGAMQQGLQGWAERVKGMASGDAELEKLCKEFVRKRILKAHGAGDLHSRNWGGEPLPTVEELRASGS
uniref:Uncharacterized protein n=1 Tax=Alexandrium catenella TaxID=2925 RepID=A0A7S1LEH7_ALECA|mmetsp:Transcript_111843/g.297272  ORF Transcript_111843/g.297272 Transcript_111843/m.297272 type:complete len:339 (+) Transcript_111843:60-1076(+)